MKGMRKAVAIAALILLAAGGGLVMLGDWAAASTPTMSGIYAVQISERFSCVAGEALVAGNAVAMKTSDGKCYKASYNDATLRPALGFVLRAWAIGVTAQVVTRGFIDGITGGTAGRQLFLGQAGGLSDDQTTGLTPWQVVGHMITATRMRIEINQIAY